MSFPSTCTKALTYYPYEFLHLVDISGPNWNEVDPGSQIGTIDHGLKILSRRYQLVELQFPKGIANLDGCSTLIPELQEEAELVCHHIWEEVEEEHIILAYSFILDSIYSVNVEWHAVIAVGHKVTSTNRLKPRVITLKERTDPAGIDTRECIELRWCKIGHQ